MILWKEAKINSFYGVKKTFENLLRMQGATIPGCVEERTPQWCLASCTNVESVTFKLTMPPRVVRLPQAVQGVGDGWAAADHAGHEHTARRGQPQKIRPSRHGVPPGLTGCRGIEGPHVPVGRGLPRLLRCIIFFEALVMASYMCIAALNQDVQTSATFISCDIAVE